MTGFYSIRVKKSAEKELRAIPKPALPRIVRRLQSLLHEPRPHGCVKLSGEEQYRIRQGDWRVAYWIDDDNKIIEIVKIGHRKDIIYR